MEIFCAGYLTNGTATGRKDTIPALSLIHIWIALAGHALPDAEAGETLTVSVGGVLDAAVGVEDEACLLYTS